MGRLLLIAAAASASVFSVPAFSQAVPVESIDQEEHIAFLNTETVSPALSVVTGNHYVSVDSDGNEFIAATATNGLQFEVHLRACESGEVRQCKAMYLLSVWDAIEPSQHEQFSEFVAAFILERPTVNAGLLEDGRPYITRYVIADFGAPQGNILSESANFLRSATEYHVELQGFFSD